MSNIACFKHPQYKGHSAPDLSCKTCCSMFVSRIREEQAAKFDKIQADAAESFKPLVGEPMSGAASGEKKAPPKFDSSWI